MNAGSVRCRDDEPPREGWDLAGRFDESGSDALFVVVQLAFMERNGSAGRFVDDGRFRSFLSELIAALADRVGPRDVSSVEPVVILAHSAGYETALAVLAHGGVEVGHVVLFDALYRGVEPFLTWAAASPERRLVSLYTGDGRTARQSAMLAARGRTVVGEGEVAYDADEPLAASVHRLRVVVARSPAPHGLVPARHIAELLPALGVGARR